MLFITVLSSALAAQAVVWNGTDVSSSLAGDGTKDRPYEVRTGADLKYIQSTPALWAKDIYFLQIDDIDLGGNELGLIGYGNGRSTSGDIGSSNFKPFFATYDGGGHKISNLLIKWDIKKSDIGWDTNEAYHYSAGMFGLLAGTVRNLHLHRPLMTRTAAAKVKDHDCDMRMGLIAGAAAPNKNGNKQVIIENIIISEGVIDDGGVATDLKAYFVGGVVGDVTCGYGGTANISGSNYGFVHIRNIYADIDFDFSNCVRTKGDAASITQFDIGGFVGRMRRGKFADLPVNVVYTGKVKAPLAAIAPSICMARCNGTNTYASMNDAYIGEVISATNSTNTGSFVKLTSSDLIIERQHVFPDENRYFSGYKIWDSDLNDYVEITGTFPIADENRWSMRTLAADGSELSLTPTAAQMRSWQGVNHGSYINLETNIGATTATNCLNSLNDPVKFAWDAVNKTYEFSSSESVSMTRNSLHTIVATVYNDNRTTDYIYSWTLTDRNGLTHTYETTRNNAATYDNAHMDIDVDLSTCTLTIKDDFRDYTKAKLTIYDEIGHSLASAELDLPDFGLTFKRRTEVVDAVTRYCFSPEYTFDDEELPLDEGVFANSPLTYAWSAFKWNGSDWEAEPSAIIGATNQPEVVINRDFVGSVRLVVTDKEIVASDFILTGDGVTDYMEQKLERLRLSFNIKQMSFNSSGVYTGPVDFNPAAYFTGSQGYAITYDYNDSNTEGFLITNEQGETHHLSATNKHGTLGDTQVPPLIFEGTVVDQFGNVVAYDPDKYRIQWSFKIPDSRSTKTFPDPLYASWDSETGYVSANGTYPDIVADTIRNGIDWVGPHYRNAGLTTSQWACDRWGEFAVEGSTTFKIHPNLLHCTSGFDVRAVLYDVSDPLNPTTVETVVSFSQVDINMQEIAGGYRATVAWRSQDIPYTSSSPYSFTWYYNPDPTDYDGWVKIDEASVDYIHDGWPNPAVQTDRRRLSEITDIDSDMFYKVEFRTSSGTYAEGIIGPENVIFVYDRAKTLGNPDFHDFDVYDGQSNYYFPQGVDTNHGRDPWHAVATMSQAFKLLDTICDYRKNRIVVMGFYHEHKGVSDKNYFMHDSWWNVNEARATTISGAYGTYIKGGTLGLGFNGTVTGKSFDLYLRKPMRWENLTLFTYNTHNSNQNCIYACNHDFIVGRGVRLINFRSLATGSGLADGVYVPNFTIVAGHYDYMARSTAWPDPIAEMDGAYKIDYTGNEVDSVTTIKILSGGFGRIIGASRNSGSKKVPAIFGTPQHPNRVRIEIDICHEPGHEKEFVPDWNVVDTLGNLIKAETFTHDLGIVVGGQTDGSTFSDTEITIRNAHVARYVSGSITYGRPITAYDAGYNLPDDAYFGRTVLNIYGGTFDEIYGGSLGRSGFGGTNMVKAFFYGHSVINLYSGVIGDSEHPTEAKVFAAGAGGIIGCGSLWNVDGRAATDQRRTYTSDDRIPFVKGGKIVFAPFDEENPYTPMPVMDCIDSDGTHYDLDLSQSKVELNLYGGIVYGDVYGGGFGYASNLTYDRVPYRKLSNVKQLQSLAGNLYGTSYVRLLPNPDPSSPDVIVYGNVYGAGAGDNRYIADSKGKTVVIDGEDYTYNFTEIAKTFGDSHVIITGGRVLGEVYGGGCGIDMYGEMANIYGEANLEISGGTIEGNIYGGAAYSDIRKYSYTDEHDTLQNGGGNTHTTISGGSIGNCVFGGGKGKYVPDDDDQTTASNVSGDVYMNILGGAFSDEPDIIVLGGGQTPKGFNIYGGGYINGTVRGDTHVNVRSSLLVFNESLGRDFSEAWNDYLDRRFCIYGAGYGELTRVEGNTHVLVDIPATASTVAPTIKDIDLLVQGQTLFDVAGGGYSGNTGYWADSLGNALYKQDHPDVDLYDHYVGGRLNVTVKGCPFIRKVIGGSFYAECNNTNTWLQSGSVKEVYGGALMGYVHDHANLNIGSKADDGGAMAGGFDPTVLTDSVTAADLNSRLFITGNVYGGNDVKGIVGTTFWTNDVPGALTLGKRGVENSDGAPLFCSDVSQALNKGVSLYIHGGTIVGNVYGAGNGHYRGYYVPDWVRYNDGPDRHYRTVNLITGSGKTTGKVYRCRPMTGSVTMHVGGNTAEDRVKIMGNLYGGGRSCTIGQWNTILPYEDPRRLVKAGYLHVNFGSHVDVTSVYMGAQGDDFMRPKELLKADLTIGDGQVPTTIDLDSIGDVAYDHWYLTADKSRYLPGFPPPGEVDGNYGMLGAHMLRGYAKNIEMNADIELTFYANPFRLHGDFTPEMSADGTTVLCKPWLPAEMAHTSYDASDMTFTNFFGGGASGFMTNNKLMRYDYASSKPVPDITYTYYNDARGYGVEYDYHNDVSSDIERFGTIYRYSLPPGLTVLDKVVGGSEDAIESTRGYTVNADETITFTTPDVYYYTFEGGMVTQCSYTYDLIVHNDLNYAGYQNNFDHAIPAEHFAGHDYPDYHTILNGPDKGKVIYRWPIPEKVINPNYADITHSRYDLACYYEDDDPGHLRPIAYCGPRESRIAGNETVLKLTVACQFDPRGDGSAPEDHASHYGGVIYGGCYNSGVTQGDVMVTVSSNTVGNHHDVTNPETFGSISSLSHNIGRVFGGGYGPDSRVDGDTYVNLILNFVGMNVFGGGCRGNVNGTAHIKYLGNENNSYVLGAIYGGGLYGSVGVPSETPVATDVHLFSGNADKVYGGSCLGSLYGRTNVEICDEVTTGLQYFDYDRLLANDDIFDWGGSRLIVGTVFGGNDVAGTITPQPAVTDPLAPGYNEKDLFATYIRTYETPHTDDPEHPEEGPGKQTPGAAGAYNGYPLIGYLYAGSNGNYGYQNEATGQYEERDTVPTITFATGEGKEVMLLKLSGDGVNYPPFGVPNVSRARLDIEGGTIVNAYGGGDRATITDSTVINVQYLHDSDIMDARAGFISEDDFVRTWNTCHLSHSNQMDEVTEMLPNASGGADRVFRYHVYRLFGGNDKAPMAIQPTWNLYSGHLGSVYSGGNFGTMTYFGRDDAGKPVGLTLRVDSPHFHADAIYGGGRVGNIEPAIDAAFRTNREAYESSKSKTNEVHNFYGATLDINQGVIDHVYGGNDVSGNVYYGTRVMLHGAISGDVYCAGNGNYLYKYDTDYDGELQECFHPELGRYFQLPASSKYGTTNLDRLLAINHNRPNVDRSYLSIAGSKEGTDSVFAYVRGNVYCGGNSSTVGVGVTDSISADGISFEIGEYSMLSGVFLGSNGEYLVEPSMMQAFEALNNINLAESCPIFTATDISNRETAGFPSHDLAVLSDRELFPHLLDVYMRAVDVYSTPSDFKMDAAKIKESYIGDFYVGGNRGSMLTRKTIALTFPHNLVIFGKIVGGSNNANVTYKGVKHIGGLTCPTDPLLDNPDPDKIYLQILSKFEPWKMTYPAKNAWGKTDYRYIKVVPDVEQVGTDLYFPESKCSVFGGCFNSGRTVGNIHIDLYSDLAGEYSTSSKIYHDIDSVYHIGTGVTDITKERVIVNGIDNLQRRSFALIGAGYGSETSVHGNIRLHMLPGQFHPSHLSGHNESPSAATIFAGSEKGEVIGNTEITVRDGVVLSNLYGGSESSKLYGSTNIIIGWPQYLICQRTGRYKLDRTDKISKYANPIHATDPNPIKKEIYLCKGDYVSVNLYRHLDHEQDGLTYYAIDAGNPFGAFRDAAAQEAFTYVGDDTPENYASHNNSDYVKFHNITWDDINIYIGNNKSRLDSRAEYYAHGNIYGGGFITANSGTTLAGENSVCKYDATHTPSPELIGYGGNSTILIWDNPLNADTTNVVGEQIGGTGAIVRDHITIGTGHYTPVNLVVGQDAMGYYKFEADPEGRYILNGVQGKYVHQSSHIIKAGDPTEYFEIESDGGIYGGGRKVYVEGFRNCDLAYYGYADYTPQYPKLLNTAQRLDLFTITDCCMMMQGAVDFASNSIDATRYSMTRIGELEMLSSLDPTKALKPGKRDETALANVIHDEHRVRNYMAFFHDVLYVSAMTSSEAFTNPYRGANGQVGYIGNFTKTGTDVTDHSVPTGSDYLELDYGATPFSYKQYKTNRIGNYYANRNLPNTDENKAIKRVTSLEFDQRNVGTAANMIGINNGYTLKIQGAVVDALGNDNVYYGPVTGVFEVKLMTLATDEGGGYIYALNQHDDPNHFLETTGNFVFPGAAYRRTSQSTPDPSPKRAAGDPEDYNYVYDDCFPMGKGWESYWGWTGTDADETTSTMGPGLHTVDTGVQSLDPGTRSVCDDPDSGGTEVHFWYVNGSNFYFNVTLTAYTYKEPEYFKLNNNEHLIYLYGVGNNSEIKLESATWDPHDAAYDSDLRNVSALADKYQLFLSIDDQPGDFHALGSDTGILPALPGNHAYITRLPRTNMAYNAAGEAVTTDGLFNPTDTLNRYSSIAGNSPLLGITLFDQQDNTPKGYYESHLSEDENVRLELTACDSTDINELTFRYIINLKIKYVKGPTIDGNLQIENDALPGEYIYANAYGVNIDIDDENMGINGRKWYLVGPDCAFTSNTTIHDYISSSPRALSIDDQLINPTDLRQVHIPAYRLRDGFNVVYEIEANGLKFYVTPSTVKPAEAEHFYPHLTVHNYHRMKPMVPMAATPEDLQLSAGAWIYIEDNADMAHFYNWLAGLQDAGCESINSGVTVNPRYAEGLTVQLMTDVDMPAAAASNLRFDGVFHGNGHNINMGNNTRFLAENYGTFYNTGFVSSRVESTGASVFDTNAGIVDCCYFYNDTDASKGRLIATNSGTATNCYTSSGSDAASVTLVSSNDFRYGRVAYDLNRFYLQQRYNTHEHTTAGVEPVTDKFVDGEYRYGAVYSDEFPFLLRTADVPNYRDYLGLRINATVDQVTSGAVLGTVATMHDVTERVDSVRAVIVDKAVQRYVPVEADYTFFGQDLTYGSTDKYPRAAYTTNRVYRASGFYGSKVDQGFHFNSKIQVLHPGLTAVDFSGVRDAAHGNLYTADHTVYADQKVWYAPQLDLPANLTDCTFDVGTRLSAAEPHVTRNLLVYREDGTLDDMSKFEYDTDTPYEQVYCHVIDVPDPADLSKTPNADYVQLVDKEDFNAPIAFNVNKTIWYRRSPALWADEYGTGWEGICLPFTANITYGSVESRQVGSYKNHGLMTHFYGPDEAIPTGGTDYLTRQTHEYWLRKFVGIADGKAYFERPASKADTDAANPQDDTYSTYHYSNEYFTNAYGEFRYTDAFADHLPPAYTATGVDYTDYSMLTAGYPYLVSFPGERYYEFDCSGKFYSRITGDGAPDAQIITFAWDSKRAEGVNPVMPVPVSDTAMTSFTHNGKTFIGTFMHCPAGVNDAVVDTDGVASTLVRPATEGERTVLPFRAYLRGTSMGAPLKISSLGIDTPVQDEESQDDDDDLSLKIYLDGRDLVIENPYETALSTPLCDVAGHVLRILDIAPGKNRYTHFTTGFYFIGNFKFYIQ